jgi:hypothetical protein
MSDMDGEAARVAANEREANEFKVKFRMERAGLSDMAGDAAR